MVTDPIPDPLAAGWTKEGDEPHFPVGTSLRITDTSYFGTCRFFAADPGAFAGEIALAPLVVLDDGFGGTFGESTGVHVAINDGDRQVRADVLVTPGAGVRVALAVIGGGYTPGFLLPSRVVSFELRRLADGSGYLSVAGRTPEVVTPLNLAPSRRLGTQTIEFGCDGTGTTVVSEWFTLGFPATLTPFTDFTVKRLELRVRA
jgi:hypothetical protein